MPKRIKKYGMSFTVTEDENTLLKELDAILDDESRAEFFRRVTVKEAKKLIKKG